MAERTATITDLPGSPGGQTVTWTGIDTGDTGDWVYVGHLVDKAMQVSGTLTEWDLQGSMDGGTTAHILNDPQGNPLSDGSARCEQILENAPYMRPVSTTTTGMKLVIFGRKSYS